MNLDDGIDLDALHQAIIDTLRQRFPDLRTVDDYPDDRQRVPAPALLIELIELAPMPDDDPGNGQLAMEANFEARYIVGFRGLDQQRAVRRNAAALAHFVHQQRWGLGIEPARVISCERDEFSPDLDEYHVWRLSWAQTVFVGESIWDDGVTPTEVWVGVSPHIGPKDQEQYRRVDGEAS